jgi:hypothetical protein
MELERRAIQDWQHVKSHTVDLAGFRTRTKALMNPLVKIRDVLNQK